MKTLIICDSKHRGNTRKIADVMAEALGATIVGSDKVQAGDLGQYDLVGFGSGIYMGKHDQNLLSLVDKLPFGSGKKVFLFSSSLKGLVQMDKNHKALKDKLRAKDYDVIGNFSCLGSATFGPLKWLGGINKNHPDAEELDLARMFAEGVGSGL
ncbi:MAG: flavodoxin family protein [Candidatus Pacebacteria bacterium]|nr:flavodoxin family protein [Candidatus Paceibacterota bacterium]